MKITGIIRPNEKSSSAMLSGSVAYTTALTEYVVMKAEESLPLQEHSKTLEAHGNGQFLRRQKE